MSRLGTGRIVRKDGSHENVAFDLVGETLVMRSNVVLRNGDHLVISNLYETLQYNDEEPSDDNGD